MTRNTKETQHHCCRFGRAIDFFQLWRMDDSFIDYIFGLEYEIKVALQFVSFIIYV